MSNSNRAVRNLEDVPTLDLHLPGIIAREQCFTHNAAYGTPCYDYPSAEGEGRHTGICNSRARAAGMTGFIQPTSLDRSLLRVTR